MFDLYEIGYIVNDAITVKYEDTPTLRLQHREIEYAQSKILLIISIRLLIYVLLTCLLSVFFKCEMDTFQIAGFALLGSYCLHNFFRNRIKYLTDLLLNTSKYVIPILVYSPLEKTRFIIKYFKICNTNTCLFPIGKNKIYY